MENTNPLADITANIHSTCEFSSLAALNQIDKSETRSNCSGFVCTFLHIRSVDFPCASRSGKCNLPHVHTYAFFSAFCSLQKRTTVHVTWLPMVLVYIYAFCGRCVFGKGLGLFYHNLWLIDFNGATPEMQVVHFLCVLRFLFYHCIELVAKQGAGKPATASLATDESLAVNWVPTES